MLGPLEVRDGAGSPREVSGPRLRRAVGEPAAVASGPAGYQLRIDRDDIDVFRFERLAARGRAALAAGPDEAAGLLTAALALWRGAPLPDAAETETGRAAVARLAELRLTATEDRIDAELRLSAARPHEAGPVRVPELIADLEGLLAASPTRETLAALLMRALAADGRRGAALEVYERTRERLADELGADPSPRLAALHLELLRAGGELPRADGRRPPVPAAAAAAAPVPRPADPGPPGNLPAALTSFLGRQGDLGKVGALLREHRLVTLTGPGGAGKTRLAIEAARTALSGGASPSGPAFPGGAWLAELAPVTDPADVAATVLSALGLREQALLVTRQIPGGR
jgi:hypothetical protein